MVAREEGIAGAKQETACGVGLVGPPLARLVSGALGTALGGASNAGVREVSTGTSPLHLALQGLARSWCPITLLSMFLLLGRAQA